MSYYKSPQFFVSEDRWFLSNPHLEGNLPDCIFKLKVRGGDQLVHQETILGDATTPNATSSN